jgi:hypothetical protein
MPFFWNKNGAAAHMEQDTKKSFGTIIRDDIPNILISGKLLETYPFAL